MPVGPEQAEKDARIADALNAYDKRDRTAPYEEQFKLWEALWEACDFSWDGLADAGWERGEDANFAQKLKRWGDSDNQHSLQDYWRPTIGPFPSFDGLLSDGEMESTGLLRWIDEKLWHVLFLPDTVIKGTDVQLYDTLKVRVARATAKGLADTPLLLIGVRAQGSDDVIRQAWWSEERWLSLRAELASLSRWNVSSVFLSSEADLGRALFGQHANFEGAKFGDRACFDQVLFGAEASFKNAAFSDNASFRFVSFGNKANFDSATFGAGATFMGAAFGDQARFSRGVFGALCGFDAATFGKGTNFEEAQFGDFAGFQDAIFGEDTAFTFATFGDEGGFDYAKFGNGVGFYGASFGQGIGFNSTTFEGSARFVDTRFRGSLDANKAKFLGPTDFREAEIAGYAKFNGCTWPDQPEDQGGAFKGCRFRDVADFETDGFKAFALFHGAEFKGRVLIEDPGGVKEDELFAEALAATSAAASQAARAKARLRGVPDLEEVPASPDFRLPAALAGRVAEKKAWREVRWTFEARAARNERRQRIEQAADRHFAALVGGLRTLKMAMAAQGDRDREQRFFRYEVQARAARPTEGPFAKRAAWLYGRASNYGVSVGRPLVWAAGVWFAFSTLYFAGSFTTTPKKPITLAERAIGAADFALTNSFRPFASLATPAKDDHSVGATLLREGPRTALLVRIAGVFQSLSTIILLFLAGVALRREFQIS